MSDHTHHTNTALHTAAVRLRFWMWLLAMLALLGVFGLQVLPRLKVDTDILGLLPSARGDQATRVAVDRFSQVLSAKLLVLVGAPQLEQAQAAAQAYAESLRKSDAFAQVLLEQGDKVDESVQLYKRHRAWLLSARHFERLSKGQGEQLQQEALRAAYTPSGLMRAMTLADDPLGLGSDYLMEQVPAMGAAHLSGNVLAVRTQDARGDEMNYVLLTLQLAGSPFATQLQEAAFAAMATARTAAEQRVAPTRVEWVTSGTMPHAAATRERATLELNVFGALETVAVMLVLFTIFGALLPLGLGAVAIGLAFVAGLCATHFAFGTVHILALVFGSSLIGGVIDYSIHFFADRFRAPAQWSPASAVYHVGDAVLLGMTTTVLAYVVLLVVPFPGLRQIAVFCIAGLITGCATVLCGYPLLYRVPKRSTPWGPRIGHWLWQRFHAWRWTPARSIVVVLIALAALAGLWRVNLQDDVRALQSSPPALLAAEKRASTLLQSGIESRYFLVQGDDAQSLLRAEEGLTAALESLKAAGQLADYTAVSRTLPSLARQDDMHRLIEQHVIGHDGALSALLQQLGFDAAATAQRVDAFAATQPLTVDAWRADPASQPYQDLWLGELEGRHASIVSLAGIRDLPALNAATQQLPGVQLIDRVSAVSEVLHGYRLAISWLLCVVYGVALLTLRFKYGWRETPLLLLPSALASVVTLGLFGWLGVPVNLFTLLALWLVLGLGVDYGIFLRHGHTAMPTAVLSVTLSATTTLLAFGLLALSATPFIRSIGLTLLLAITLSWLFAMLSCVPARMNQQQFPQTTTVTP